MRVIELAQDLKVDVKVLIALLRSMRIAVSEGGTTMIEVRGLTWKTGQFSRKRVCAKILAPSWLMTVIRATCFTNIQAVRRVSHWICGGVERRCAPGTHYSKPAAGNGTV